LALDPDRSATAFFAQEAYDYYAALYDAAEKARASDDSTSEPLGGMLLYVGELDQAGRALVAAGNVAGAASLCATADPVAQKQAIHDGIVDFLVTSLDEALRILKNEIRKREPVAVCVGSSPAEIEREMFERGVLPDLNREDAIPGPINSASTSALNSDPLSVPALVDWRVHSAPAQWLPKLDAIALDCLSPEDKPGRRWLRLAPRYLGRLAQVHVIRSDREFAALFIEHVRAKFDAGEIQVPALIQVSSSAGPEEYNFTPTNKSNPGA
jgi:hypothetical protein